VAIFIGSFTLDTAVAIAEEEGMSENDVAGAIESLVDKSMIEAGVDTQQTSYRLLDTNRTYALEKLLHRGEHNAIATRHANLPSTLLEESSVDPFEMQSSAPGLLVTQSGSEMIENPSRDRCGSLMQKDRMNHAAMREVEWSSQVRYRFGIRATTSGSSARRRRFAPARFADRWW
jgi:hypothetical protein